ncbi:MAG: hypothetical protein ACKPKO_32045, partial [Candidatus Fonsibacter sp.]
MLNHRTNVSSHVSSLLCRLLLREEWFNHPSNKVSNDRAKKAPKAGRELKRPQGGRSFGAIRLG